MIQNLFRYLFPLTSNVDIVHVSCGDLLANLGDQVQNELDIIRLACPRVNIPREKLVNIQSLLFLPASLISIGGHDDAVISEERSKTSGVSLTSPACVICYVKI